MDDIYRIEREDEHTAALDDVASLTLQRIIVEDDPPQQQQQQQQQQRQQGSGGSGGGSGSDQAQDSDSEDDDGYGDSVEELKANLGEQFIKDVDLRRMNYFVARLKSVLKDNSFDRFVDGKRAGRLTKRGLYKFITHNTKLFRKKQEQKNKNYNVLICVDQSGSMDEGCPSRMTIASKLAAMLTMAFQKVDINVAVMGYATQRKMHKEFDQPRKINTKSRAIKFINEIYYGMYVRGNGTRCGFALEKANEVLVAGENNITIILNDGGVGMLDDVRRELKRLKRKSDIITLGLGDDFGVYAKELFPNSVVVHNEDELIDETLKKLSFVIKRG